jgi:hypothetical protein
MRLSPTTREVPLRTLACAVAAAALTLGAPAAALAHQGNPNYRSEVTRITPAVKGVSVSVLNYDDRLLLKNASGADVLVLDYQKKPYIRAAADGTVAVNTNSEAYYLNEDRFGESAVPKGLGAQPAWKVVSRNGRYDWHDHRMHWMGKNDPPQLKDKGVRTKIDDWTVPLQIGGRDGAVSGTLTWVPKPSEPLPLGAIFAFGGLLILLSLGVFLVRRRRDAEPREKEAAEAW